MCPSNQFSDHSIDQHKGSSLSRWNILFLRLVLSSPELKRWLVQASRGKWNHVVPSYEKHLRHLLEIIVSTQSFRRREYFAAHWRVWWTILPSAFHEVQHRPRPSLLCWDTLRGSGGTAICTCTCTPKLPAACFICGGIFITTVDVQV